jgi:hypothetical protein
MQGRRKATIKGNRLGSMLVCALIGCSDASPREPEGEASASREARSEAAGRSETESGSEAETASAETDEAPGDACASDMRARTPEALRDALHGLGWSDVYVDACATDAARRTGDPSACDALSVRPLREHCRDRVAIEQRTPLACHGDEDGHDPLCLALASRRASLCGSVPLSHRALCEALLGRGVERCERGDVPSTSDCRAEHEALSTLVGEPSPEPRITTAVSLRTVRVVDLGAHHTREEPIEEDLTSNERGALLRWEGCTPILEVGEARAEPLARRTRRFVSVRLPEGARDAVMEVALGSDARALVERNAFGRAEAGPIAGGRGTVRVDPFEAELGAPVHLHLRGELSRSPGHVEVELDVRTQIRDVVGTPSEDCDASE